ncbi:MAG TPA: Gfo/Idh/MocA family oxidoreductase [Chloroflexi bacterium]|nr:Gfo/Idh/MocA family oxidoreductase [Chloroflexota bacterium]
MTLSTLKAAVIGVGSMGRNHARVYRELEETQLVAVADSSDAARTRTARDNMVKGYADYRQMLEEAQPDVVSIVVPTEEHHQVALEAMEAGCDVLVEKPIAATVAQALEMIACAHRLGRKLMVGHIVRFDAAVQQLQQRLASGELGRVFEVRSRRLGPFPARIRDVGVIIDLATHDLDITSYVTGQPIVRVYAETERRIHSCHEDILAGTVRLQDGTIGLLDINWLTPAKIRELTVTGEKGMFLVDYMTQDLYYYENQDAVPIAWDSLSMLKGVSEGRMIRYPVAKTEPLKVELQAFACSVIHDTPTPVTGEDGVAALSAALALVQSGAEHRSIDIQPMNGMATCSRN